MFLRPQLHVTVLAQFIALGLLNIGTSSHSVIAACTAHKDCISNIITSSIFFILVVLWFGAVCLLGFTVQNFRNRRLALLLIGAELLVLFVALINIRGHGDPLSLATSIIDSVLALLVIYLSIRVIRSGTARIVPSRARRMRREFTDKA